MSRLYGDAGRIVSEVLERKGGIKTLTMAKKVRNKPKMHALVSETLRYREVLLEVMKPERCGVDESVWSVAKFRGVLLVMLYEFLLGHGIKGGGALKRVLKEHESALRGALNELRAEAGAQDSNELLLPKQLRRSEVVPVPRFARVNTLRCGVDAAAEALRSKGGGGHSVAVDPHVPGLLVLPPRTDLHAHPLVKSGQLILQDKASCLPAHILLEQAGADADLGDATAPYDVIDCCAAPGNKTSHAAAILGKRRRAAPGVPKPVPPRRFVYAFDKSQQRLALLRRRMKEANAASVRATLCDFLSLDPTEPQWASVKAVLLDPSCSGTGMPQHHLLDSLDSRKESADGGGSGGSGSAKSAGGEGGAAESAEVARERELQKRAAKLAEFQLKAIKHAFLFPSAARLTYSTCSILATENEEVVAAALAWSREQRNAAAGGGWELVPALPSWHRRGIACDGLTAAESKCLVRVDRDQDKMNGFFVTLFRRAQPASVPPPAPAPAPARGTVFNPKGRRRTLPPQEGGRRKKKRTRGGSRHKITLPRR